MKRWAEWAMLGLLAALLPTSTVARQTAVGGVVMPLYPKGSTGALGVPETRERIAEADWLLDLGPEGGTGGGKLVIEGTPEQVVAAYKKSHTGEVLREFMNRT